MKKWAFVFPPLGFLIIGLGIRFHDNTRLSAYFPMLILLTFILGIGFIFADKTLKTLQQKLIYAAVYVATIMGLSFLGGVIAGVWMGLRHQG